MGGKQNILFSCKIISRVQSSCSCRLYKTDVLSLTDTDLERRELQQIWSPSYLKPSLDAVLLCISQNRGVATWVWLVEPTPGDVLEE